MVACKIIKEKDYRAWIDKIRKIEKFKDNNKIIVLILFFILIV